MDTSDPRTRSAITLGALCVVLVLMIVVGWKSATAAFPELSSQKQQETCENPEVTKVIHRREITVSVYNASKRPGLADTTMGSMERRNFKVGAIGNTQASGVSTVEVRTTSKDDPRAQLVAMQYQPQAKVVVTADDLGPGVDVVLGAKAPRPHVPAPKKLTLDKPITTCQDKTTVNPTTGVGE